MARHTTQSGFTLLELSIVLIIIGLIVSGIFVGEDLIQSAKIRKQIKQLEEFDTAVSAFEGKYNCLPGDCKNASEFNFTSVDGNATHINGDGDGVVFLGSLEMLNFFKQLVDAQMIIPGRGYTPSTPMSDLTPGISTPPLVLDGTYNTPGDHYNVKGGFTVSSASGRTFWDGPINGGEIQNHAWLLTSNIFYYNYSGIYLPEVAYAIDKKLDDGYPTTGNVRAPNIVVNSTNIFDYIYDGEDTDNLGSCLINKPPTNTPPTTPPLYNVGTSVISQGTYCALLIQAAF